MCSQQRSISAGVLFKYVTTLNTAYVMLTDNVKDTGRPSEAFDMLRQGLEEYVKNAK